MRCPTRYLLSAILVCLWSAAATGQIFPLNGRQVAFRGKIVAVNTNDKTVTISYPSGSATLSATIANVFILGKAASLGDVHLGDDCEGRALAGAANGLLTIGTLEINNAGGQGSVAADNLTGVWYGDDGGSYYLSQDGTDVWWVGLSNDNGLQSGLSLTTAFRGTISGDQIQGNWADMSRGPNRPSGQLTLAIQFSQGVATGLTVATASGVFRGKSWSRGPAAAGALTPIDDLLRQITKNVWYWDVHDAKPERESLRRNLEPAAEPVVLFGTITCRDGYPFSTSFPASRPRDWTNFLGLQSQPYGNWGVDQDDADVNGDLVVDFDYLPDRFYAPMTDAHATETQNKIVNGVHLEMVMFGRPEKGDVSLLPGWADVGANSVLINGRPLEGRCDLSSKITSEFAVGGKTIHVVCGTRVRVTGALVFDVGHDERQLEMHPVYAVDVIDENASGQFAGVWGDDAQNTYYVRETEGGSTWVLVLPAWRSGHAAFVCECKGRPGGWDGAFVSVTTGEGGGKGQIHFSPVAGRAEMIVTGDVPFAPAHIRKLYDE